MSNTDQAPAAPAAAPTPAAPAPAPAPAPKPPPAPAAPQQTAEQIIARLTTTVADLARTVMDLSRRVEDVTDQQSTLHDTVQRAAEAHGASNKLGQDVLAEVAKLRRDMEEFARAQNRPFGDA